MVMASESGWREPMLATLVQRPFSSENWLFERKLDGVRVVSSCAERGVRLWSRNHRALELTYPEIAEALDELAGADFIADGEIVAFDGEQTSFAKLQQRIHLTDNRRIRATGVRVYYYVFDLLAYDGRDVTTLALRQRKKLLRQAFDWRDPVRYSGHRNTDGEEFFAKACAQGWEGVIAKRADAPYHSGRSTDWLKFKCVKDQEFVIGGFTPPGGSRIGFGALLIGYYQDGKLRYAGKVGTGYNYALLRELSATLTSMEQGTSPFADQMPERHARWVEPGLVAEIAFSDWTNDGRLRHPRFKGLREDKRPAEVVREQ
jgi:DNA ligase D-like protein (predicted ligase)